MSATFTVQEKDFGLDGIIRRAVAMAGDSYALVGIFEGAVAEEDGKTASIAEYAGYNEFGTSKIPARPWMRTGYDQSIARIQAQMDGAALAALDGANVDPLTVGAVNMQEALKRSIVDGNWAPNAPSTIEAKGSSRPLIDTGAMRNAVLWQIRQGEGPGES